MSHATAAALPFQISVAQFGDNLTPIILHRARAYAQMAPDMGALLSKMEAADAQSPGREILVARSKLDGEVIGSMRIHVNSESPLPIQSCVDLPTPLKTARLLEACRLSVTGGLVCRHALFKALMLYAHRHAIDFCVVAAKPRVSILYESICFEEIEPGRLHELSYANNAEHKALWLPLNPSALAEKFAARKKSLHDFYFNTHHGNDIDISGALDPFPPIKDGLNASRI